MRKLFIAWALVFLPLLAWGQETQQATLNKKNLVVKEWNTNAKGTSKMLDHLTTYSSDGKKIEEIEYDTDGHQKWRKRYEWGENGRMSKELVYDAWNRLVNYKTFEYNAFGKKHLQYTYDPKGRLTSTKLYEYISADE
jgi:YD repeat-containing protein